jgi:hypothetical protein
MSHGNVADFTRVMAFGGLCMALLCFGAPAAANAEMKKLCAEAQGESEKRQCAKDKRTDLSAGCRAAAGG